MMVFRGMGAITDLVLMLQNLLVLALWLGRTSLLVTMVG